MDLSAVELLILDVDGVLTDGRILAGPDEGWAKGFYVQDGCAVKLWQRAGGKAAIVTGRADGGVDRRAAELGVELVFTGVADKLEVYCSVLKSTGIEDSSAAYIGDDLPDLGPMSRAGFPVAVRNAHPTVKRASRYVTRREGGRGAVAEVVELLLRKRGSWSQVVHGEGWARK